MIEAHCLLIHVAKTHHGVRERVVAFAIIALAYHVPRLCD